jgi:ATP-binding cassette subfamily B (MDR/TAP) protein 10
MRVPVMCCLGSCLQAVGGTVMLVYLSPSLALLSLVVIPPVGVVGVLYGRYVKKRQKEVQAALGKSMEVSWQFGS